jgi:hypothetical protein
MAGHVGLEVPGGEQGLGDAAQLGHIIARVNGPGMGLKAELTGQGKVTHEYKTNATKLYEVRAGLGANLGTGCRTLWPIDRLNRLDEAPECLLPA